MIRVFVRAMRVDCLHAALIAAGFCWASPGAAAPLPSEPHGTAGASAKSAKELFAESAEHYQRGEFGKAIELLQQAFAIAHEPVLLYNLGRAYEGDGQLDEAVSAYERYLELEPDIPDRGALDKRIATLRRQIEERRALEQQAAEARAAEQRAAAQPSPEPIAPSPWPWVLVGVGAAGVAVGGILGALASSREEDADLDPIHESASESFAEARSYATAANVCFIAGGAVALGGLVWGIVDVAGSGDPSAPDAVAVRVGPLGIVVDGAIPW